MEKLYTVSEKQDLELTEAQIISSLQQNSGLNQSKWGKTTRPFRYDLNQTHYDYTVEVMNRFKGFDLVDRVLDKLWTEVHNTVPEAVTKTIPKKKKCQKEKQFPEEALQIPEERKEAKIKGERERCRVPENSKER